MFFTFVRMKYWPIPFGTVCPTPFLTALNSRLTRTEVRQREQRTRDDYSGGCIFPSILRGGLRMNMRSLACTNCDASVDLMWFQLKTLACRCAIGLNSIYMPRPIRPIARATCHRATIVEPVEVSRGRSWPFCRCSCPW